MLWRLHRDLYEHVASLGAAQDREPLAAQAEIVARLGARRNFHLRLGTVYDRDLYFPAKRRLGHPQRHTHHDIGLLALEELMRPDSDMNVEVAVLGALTTGLAFA